jgi:hypothetical protein
MYVYDTGRDLLDLGIIPLDNMRPETACMKLAWVLGVPRRKAAPTGSDSGGSVNLRAAGERRPL